MHYFHLVYNCKQYRLYKRKSYYEIPYNFTLIKGLSPELIDNVTLIFETFYKT